MRPLIVFGWLKYKRRYCLDLLLRLIMDGYMCEQIKHGKAVSTILIENERARVTEWRFKKYGDNTGWHRHEYDYIVVPLFDGQLEINVGSNENTIAAMKSGVPYFREVGVEHDVINGNDFECAFVEIEFLSMAAETRNS